MKIKIHRMFCFNNPVYCGAYGHIISIDVTVNGKTYEAPPFALRHTKDLRPAVIKFIKSINL